MARFKKTLSKVHQVTIDEYLAAQQDLFPDGVLVPASKSPYTQPWRVKNSAPVFPGAVDGIGAVPDAPTPPSVVYSRHRRS